MGFSMVLLTVNDMKKKNKGMIKAGKKSFKMASSILEDFYLTNSTNFWLRNLQKKIPQDHKF